MDECTEWELTDMLEMVPYCDRAIWESSRINAYVQAQVNSKKKLKLTDIAKFAWEGASDKYSKTKKEDTKMSNADIARLKKIASQWEPKDEG